MGDPPCPQELDHPVGNVALGDAVERHAHARSQETDDLRPETPAAEADPRQGGGARRGRRAVGIGPRLAEMAGIELPKRLDGDVEHPAGERVIRRTLAEDADEVGRRRLELSSPVERHQRRVCTVEAHDRLEPPHLGQGLGDEPVRHLRIGVVELQHGIRPQRHAGPDAKPPRLAPRAERQQRQPARRRGDAEKPPPPQSRARKSAKRGVRLHLLSGHDPSPLSGLW